MQTMWVFIEAVTNIGSDYQGPWIATVELISFVWINLFFFLSLKEMFL